MTRIFRHPAFYGAVSVVLGALFVYASLDKILHPRDFARIVYRYRLLGPSAATGVVPANLLAVTLPWIEALAGALLVVGLWRREAAGVTAALLVVFLAAVGSVLVRGIDVEHCGCFSVKGTGRSAGLALLAEDIAMLAGALYVARGRPERRPAA